MNSKKRLRINVLNGMTVVTFIVAMLFTFFDVTASYLLLLTSFVIAVFTLFLRMFWSQVKQLKQKDNGKQ